MSRTNTITQYNLMYDILIFDEDPSILDSDELLAQSDNIQKTTEGSLKHKPQQDKYVFMNSYSRFVKENYHKIVADNPSAKTQKDRMRLCAREWRLLNEAIQI